MSVSIEEVFESRSFSFETKKLGLKNKSCTAPSLWD